MAQGPFFEQFAGKVAAITGGTQGLGEATARLLAARGAAGIAICGRNRERGEQVAREIEQAGCPAQYVQADLARMDDCRAFIDAAERRFDRLDVLINCAAATDRGRLETTTEEIWDTLFTLNVKSQFFLIQRAVEVMRRHKIEGAIANIGTIVAYGGPPFLIAVLGLQGRPDDPDPRARQRAQARSHPDQHAEHRLDQHAARARRADRGPRPAARTGSRRRAGTSRSAA